MLGECSQFWSPQLRKDIDAKERVQCRATRLILGLARLNYEERLKETGLYTRERRRLRGDMIEMFKIMKGIDKISGDELFNRVDSDRTRGHSLRVKKRRVKTVLKALSHLDVSASVCRRMKNCSKTLAHVEYVMGKFCIR